MAAKGGEELDWSAPFLFEVEAAPSLDEVDQAMAVLQRHRERLLRDAPASEVATDAARGAASNLFKNNQVFLWDDTTGATASGNRALFSNSTGAANTASGDRALVSNTTGSSNTASGMFALVLNTTGSGNTAVGRDAGHNATTGNDNIGSGAFGMPGEGNTIRIGVRRSAPETPSRTALSSTASAASPPPAPMPSRF